MSPQLSEILTNKYNFNILPGVKDFLSRIVSVEFHYNGSGLDVGGVSVFRWRVTTNAVWSINFTCCHTQARKSKGCRSATMINWSINPLDLRACGSAMLSERWRANLHCFNSSKTKQQNITICETYPKNYLRHFVDKYFVYKIYVNNSSM